MDIILGKTGFPHYVIDFDKVTTLDDVIAILKAFNIKVYAGESTEVINYLLKEAEQC